MTDAPPVQRTGKRVRLKLDTKGGANQADGPGANINTLVAQYKKNGTLPIVATSNPLWGDFTFPEDIHSVREAVHEAEDRFMELPADIRTLCNNDWVQFLERFNTPDGKASLEQAGLIIQNTPPTPLETAPIPNNSPTPSVPPSPTDPPPGTPPTPTT